MTDFVRLLNSPSGRLARIALGAAPFTVGMRRRGIGGAFLVLVSLLPMVPAFFARCA